MKTSRQQVLEYIHAHYPLTAADLSQALQMTPANARHHLSILQQRGLVRPAGQRPPQGKGRPARLFMPSESALGHNLDLLASALLELLQEQDDPAAADLLPRRLAALIARPEAAALRPQTVAGESLTRRLYHAVQRLNELHYQARWEAWRGAPRLILGHCPYAAIIHRHPQLCRLDAFLLEELTGEAVEQTGKLTPDSKGALHCHFRIVQGHKNLIKMQGF